MLWLQGQLTAGGFPIVPTPCEGSITYLTLMLLQMETSQKYMETQKRSNVEAHSHQGISFPSFSQQTHIHRGIPQLPNNTHLLSSLSLRNALHIYNNLLDNTLTSCQASPTHTILLSSWTMPNPSDSSWYFVTLAFLIFTPAATSCLTALWK